jgi:hypothetical protein
MNSTARLVAAAAVTAVAVGLVGYQILFGPNDLSPEPGALPTLASDPASSALAVPSGSVPDLDRSHIFPPPGVYAWIGEPGEWTAIHSVTEEGSGYRQAQVVFAVESDCFAGGEGPDPASGFIGGRRFTYVEPYVQMDGRQVMFFERGEETTGAWAIAVGDRLLCVYLSRDPTTTRDELEGAWELVYSIQAEPMGDGGVRMTFTLPDGWDRA